MNLRHASAGWQNPLPHVKRVQGASNRYIARVVCQSAEKEIPKSDKDVLTWVETEFEKTVMDDEMTSVTLLKVCMLLSLGEAAAEILQHANYQETYNVDKSGIQSASLDNAKHILTSGSTWNLNLIEQLAMSVKDHFLDTCTSSGIDGEYDELKSSYPMMLVSSINMVLFERHGYRRMRKFGNPWYVQNGPFNMQPLSV